MKSAAFTSLVSHKVAYASLAVVVVGLALGLGLGLGLRSSRNDENIFKDASTIYILEGPSSPGRRLHASSDPIVRVRYNNGKETELKFDNPIYNVTFLAHNFRVLIGRTTAQSILVNLVSGKMIKLDKYKGPEITWGAPQTAVDQDGCIYTIFKLATTADLMYSTTTDFSDVSIGAVYLYNVTTATTRKISSDDFLAVALNHAYIDKAVPDSYPSTFCSAGYGFSVTGQVNVLIQALKRSEAVTLSSAPAGDRVTQYFERTAVHYIQLKYVCDSWRRVRGGSAFNIDDWLIFYSRASSTRVGWTYRGIGVSLSEAIYRGMSKLNSSLPLEDHNGFGWHMAPKDIQFFMGAAGDSAYYRVTAWYRQRTCPVYRFQSGTKYYLCTSTPTTTDTVEGPDYPMHGTVESCSASGCQFTITSSIYYYVVVRCSLSNGIKCALSEGVLKPHAGYSLYTSLVSGGSSSGVCISASGPLVSFPDLKSSKAFVHDFTGLSSCDFSTYGGYNNGVYTPVSYTVKPSFVRVGFRTMELDIPTSTFKELGDATTSSIDSVTPWSTVGPAADNWDALTGYNAFAAIPSPNPALTYIGVSPVIRIFYPTKTQLKQIILLDYTKSPVAASIWFNLATNTATSAYVWRSASIGIDGSTLFLTGEKSSDLSPAFLKISASQQVTVRTSKFEDAPLAVADARASTWNVQPIADAEIVVGNS
jgi:hypothetical protein